MATPPTTPRGTALPHDIEWRLPRHPRSVGRARTLFREQARMWNIPDDVAETAVLLLSELTTNAYRHAKVPPGREIRARCVERDGRLRLTVTDASDVLPVVRETGPKGIDTYELPQPSARSSLRDQGDSNGPFNSH